MFLQRSVSECLLTGRRPIYSQVTDFNTMSQAGRKVLAIRQSQADAGRSETGA